MSDGVDAAAAADAAAAVAKAAAASLAADCALDRSSAFPASMHLCLSTCPFKTDGYMLVSSWILIRIKLDFDTYPVAT